MQNKQIGKAEGKG